MPDPGTEAAARLAATGVVCIERGLTEAEFADLERSLGFEFAEDHRAFLAAGLPAGPMWPNWRGEAHRRLRQRMQLPSDGILFAVEWDDFWPAGWGPRPARMKDALRSANYHLGLWLNR